MAIFGLMCGNFMRQLWRIYVSNDTTVREWMRRFEQEDLPGWADKSRAPKAPARQAWLPLMIAVSHRQKRHPDAGRFRMWSL